MYLLTILAYIILFWRVEAPGEWCLVGESDVIITLLIVLVQPPFLGLIAWLSARRSRRSFSRRPDAPQDVQRQHHRATLWLRSATIVGFGVAVLGTRWPVWFTFESPELQIFGDLAVLSLFVANVLAVWLATYPLERDLRIQAVVSATGSGAEESHRWRLRSYLDFNLRHQVLVVAVPLTLILFAANMTRGYEKPLRTWSGWTWTPDVLLGLVAFGVFLVAPVLLIRIWRTSPLEAGPTRERLEALCRTVGLRVRNILVWQSDKMTINAAVMGVVAPVRFVLLSDGLLATMDSRQIEAVFGHEAGHVRHHHIQHLLVFALVGWLLAAASMEVAALAVVDSGTDSAAVSAAALQGIQGLGVLVTAVYWGLGFGWLSRRFERQADLFGAQSITPEPAMCGLPCSVHPDTETVLRSRGRVCSTGAALFSSALERVAMLNGIPREERSWRHSSIGSRIRFLTSLAGDPRRGEAFEQMVRRVKLVTLALATIGSAVWVYYWTVATQPGIVQVGRGGL